MRRAERYAEHGYAVVVQDCRGCHSSEGDLVFLVNEPFRRLRRRGVDGPAGVVRREGGDLRHLLRGLDPEHPGHAEPSSSRLHDPRHGRLERLYQLGPPGWGLRAPFSGLGLLALRQSRERRNQRSPWLQEGLSSGPDFRHWLRRLPLRRGQSQLSLLPGYERWALELVRHGDYDEYWKQPGFAIEEFLEQHSDVPILLIGGWYDSYTRATLEAFQALRSAKTGPVKVVMGPWVHGTYTTEEQLSGDAGPGTGSATGESGPPPSGLVRPVAQGPGDGRGPHAGHPVVPHGRRQAGAGPAWGIWTTAGIGARETAGRCRRRRPRPITCIRTGPCRPAPPTGRNPPPAIATIRGVRSPPSEGTSPP